MSYEGESGKRKDRGGGGATEGKYRKIETQKRRGNENEDKDNWKRT